MAVVLRFRAAAVAVTVAVAGLPASMLVAGPAQASFFGDARVVSGEAFLTNGYVEVGSRANGTFGSNSAAPSGYHPRTNIGTKLGFRVDRDKDGWGVGVDDGDFFTPGSPYEGWGFQVGDGGTARWNTDSATAIAGTYGSPTLVGSEAQATWTSTAPVDGLSVTQLVTVPTDDLYLAMDVTLTNTTGSPMTNVYYVRGLDADNCRMVATVSCDSDGDGVADTSTDYQTRNRILRQVRDGDAFSAVSATQTDGSYLDLRSSDTGSLAATATLSGQFCTDPAGLNAFYSVPPAVASCPVTTTKGADVFFDDLIYQLIQTPTLAAGASRTLHLKYFLDAASSGTNTQAQTITFPQPADTQFSAGQVTLTAIASSALAVAYTSSTGATCSVSGSTVTFLAAGTCTIVAAQAGNGSFDPASSVSRSFTILQTPAAPPTAANLSSTGIGTAPQHATVTIPTGGSVSLLDGSNQPATTVTLTGIGTYVLDPATGVVTFTAALGYSGTPTSVTYRVTNLEGISNTALYGPTVTKPAGPTPGPLTSTGPETQQVTVPLAVGESVTLLDAAGDPTAGPVTITGEGTYALNPTTGIITFTPVAGFSGAGVGIGFRITDAYAQHGFAAYTPTVGSTPDPTSTPTPEPTSTSTPAPKPLPKIERAKLAKIPANPKKVKGKERKTKAFNSSFSGIDAHPIVRLGDRQLQKDEAATLSGDGLFDFDSPKLTKKGRAQVKAVVDNLKEGKSIRCEGYTDYAGSRDHEIDLSTARAKAVCTALKTYGATATTKTKGYGPKRPVVIGGTPKGRKENRRVVILVTG